VLSAKASAKTPAMIRYEIAGKNCRRDQVW
jgi:hypothetical protein